MEKEMVLLENEFGKQIEYELIDALDYDGRLFVALHSEREPMEFLIMEGQEVEQGIYLEFIQEDGLLDRIVSKFDERLPMYRKKVEILMRKRMEESQDE